MPEKGAVISDRLSLCAALESGQAVGGTEVRMPSDGTANGNFTRKLTGVHFSHTHHALVDFGLHRRRRVRRSDADNCYAV